MYRLGEYGNHVIISGSLAMHDEAMCRIIEKELDRDIVVEIPKHPPIFGAMRTCLELDGIKVDYDSFAKRFSESYSSKQY